MCTRPITIRVPANPYEVNVLGLQGFKEVNVPCGKCPECLGKRQKDISVRAYREAQHYGSCYFVTLTYKPDSVPFAQTLLDINKDTGEVLIDRCPEPCYEGMVSKVRGLYKGHSGKVFYHYETIASARCDDDCLHEFQVVYTPTLYVRDVRLRIKNFRVIKERDLGHKLDFKYICVGEYGSKSKGSHRPHYHLLFFGLTKELIYEFCHLWNLGFYYVEGVNFKNVDGSDGLAKVSSYIGKYAAKGSFNPDSVTNHLVLPSRICASRGVGLCNINNLLGYYRCYDIVGKYDIDKFDIPSDKEGLLLSECFKRLKYSFNGHEISLPMSLRRKIFGYRLFDGKAVWSILYYKVMAFARAQFEDNDYREFRKFCWQRLGVPLAKICREYNMVQTADLRAREAREIEHMRSFYSSSKF